MRRPLLFHIGLPKTGTTSIQLFLAENREALQALGIYYPHTPGRVSHGLLAASVVTDVRRLWGPGHRVWQGLAPDLRLNLFRAEWAKEMDALPDWVTRCVMSSEVTSVMLRRREDVLRFAGVLRQHFDPVHIIVYLRRQDMQSASAYSQWLRNGQLLPAALPAEGQEDQWNFDYAALLDMYAAAFGEAAIVPRIFEPESLKNGDAVADFLHAADIKLDIPEATARRRNPSLAMAGQALLLRAGTRIAQSCPDASWRTGATWMRLSESISAALPGAGWKPSRDEARAFVARYAASNEAVRARFLPQRAALFSDDFTMFPEADSQAKPAQVADAAVRALLHLLEEGRERETRGVMNEFRLARTLGRRQTMRRLLQRLLELSPENPVINAWAAERALDDGEYERAAIYAAAALRADPESRHALLLQSAVHRRLKSPPLHRRKRAFGRARLKAEAQAPAT